MKINQIRALNADLIRYIVISFVLLSFGVLGVIGTMEWINERDRIESFSRHIEHSMNHIVTRDIEHYVEILQILADTPDVINMMKKSDHDALYRFIVTQWEQMKHHEPHLSIMQS